MNAISTSQAAKGESSSIEIHAALERLQAALLDGEEMQEVLDRESN